MKNSILLIVLALFIQYSASPQSCLPNGISFTTQEEIDNFQTNYPGCTEIEGNLSINSSEIKNLNGLSVLTSVAGRMDFFDNDSLESLIGLENIINVGGDLEITQNNLLIELNGLGNLTTVNGNVLIAWNDQLSSLKGLENLYSIGGDLSITENETLPECNGLISLTSIGGTLEILLNPMLTSLNGLNSVTSVGGSLLIFYNDNISDLTGLSSITSISGVIRLRNNPSLTNLSGLENIAAESIQSINIVSNDLLTTCDVKSVCNFLAAPNGTIEIFDNAIGCNSQEEVEEACESIGVIDNNLILDISIYPNPAKKLITISINNGKMIDEVNIYNQLGQQVLSEFQIFEKIDISSLIKGIYVTEIVANETRITKNLIIE